MYGPDRSAPADRSRGQSYVLEAIGAGVIVISAVVFAIQATAVTPLSVSTASEHVENQEQAQAETLLEQASRNGTLRDAVLYWNPDNRTFVDGTSRGYVGSIDDPPPNEFLTMVERVFNDSQIATNVYVYPGRSGQQRLLYQGTPSDNAISASHTFVLYNDTRLTGPYADRTLEEVSTNESIGFYAPPAAPDSPVYTVVEVRIVVWRM